ncbi:heavy-metal-associated domain-containing protein [Parasphingorhabdus sp. DH2-15]|uniref:heavy-metal-associated domain-containing protein n=1 Tax=Parasphingorhabdus sp. DH2-15 TaxID=3444112 RepID=UPI003F6880D2
MMIRNTLYPIAMIVALAAMLGLSGSGYSQIESERGISPINSSGDFEVSGIKVNITGASAEEARRKGWQLAQRRGWAELWRSTNRNGAAPALSDSRLNNIVSGVVIEQEQIGPRRYVATLGILFDRARTGQILGIRGVRLRSAPMLVIPVFISGGSEQVFESRTPWQRAWANFRTADSSIDYVRPSGAGSESLLLTAGQTGRRDRNWWRLILDNFGAADVLVPIVRLQRQYPNGPVRGYFTAMFGPDRKKLGSFELTAANGEALDEMLVSGVERMDAIYREALARGALRPDTSLIIDDGTDEEELEEEVLEEEIETDDGDDLSSSGGDDAPAAPVQPSVNSFSVQYATPDVAAVSSAEGSVRGISGVASASTSSLALGGTSVMNVAFSGSADQLKAALESRGWQVQQSGNVLRISRGGGQ